MKAKFIYEKFTEDSDPIHDMGIGMNTMIDEWIKTLGLYRPISAKDTKEVIRQCIWHKKYDILKYLIETRDDYDKNTILSTCLSHDLKLSIIDLLIKHGAKFESLEDKMTYVVGRKGTLVKITPEEELMAASKMGNFKEFKDKIESGVPLTIGMVNSIFKREWLYKSGAKGKYDEIKDYLRNNINKLETIIHKKDHQKLDKIKKYLSLSAPSPKKYPNGYKIYRLLKHIDTGHVSSYKEMSEFMYNLSYGANTYNYLTNPSYWKDGFPVLVSPRVHIDKNGIYRLNSKGIADLAKMEAKFGPMKIKAHI